MSDGFQIFTSTKNGLNSPESYVVVREKTSYLRLLGRDPRWDLVTATASEDNGRIKVCNDKLRLVESALRLGAELESKPTVEKDWMGREYVTICVVFKKPGQEQVSLLEGLTTLLTRFFKIYDDHHPLKSRSGDEMRELYSSIATNNQGNDVYLSDGVWLSGDGSLHDRGR
ncbi:MAG TPA: hypothetical protein PLK04_11260 [Bacillota bacterium]|nr:hypothetical protein [Bacillota bacterium]